MSSSRRSESAFLVTIVLLLTFSLAYKLRSLARIYRTTDEVINGGIWTVDRKHVALAFDSGLHYGLNASHAWHALIPGGSGLIHLPLPSPSGSHPPPAAQAFLPSMFHQLACLDVLRAQLLLPRAARTEQPARHCANYVRQMILCRADSALDPYQYPSNVHPVDPHPVRRCLDWCAVYEAVEDNQRAHAAAAQMHG